MKFKGLPFYFSLRLKYNEKRGRGREEGGRLRVVGMRKRWRRRERGRERTESRESSDPFTVNLNFEIDWLKLAVNQHLRGSRLLL